MPTIIMGPESYTKELVDYIKSRINIWENKQREANIKQRMSIAPDFVLSELDLLLEKINKGTFDEEKNKKSS